MISKACSSQQEISNEQDSCYLMPGGLDTAEKMSLCSNDNQLQTIKPNLRPLLDRLPLRRTTNTRSLPPRTARKRKPLHRLSPITSAITRKTELDIRRSVEMRDYHNTTWGEGGVVDIEERGCENVAAEMREGHKIRAARCESCTKDWQGGTGEGGCVGFEYFGPVCVGVSAAN